MGVGGQRHAPAALPPGKIRYPLHRRLGWPQGRSGINKVRILQIIRGMPVRDGNPSLDWARV